MLDRRPGRKPPPNVSIEDRDYIYAVVKGTAKRRNLSSETAEKYTQMLYKAANYLGERGQSLKGSDDVALNHLSSSVFKTNKHVGIALRALQKHRGGSSARLADVPRTPQMVPLLLGAYLLLRPRLTGRSLKAS
ncbi:hypothetical protein ACVIWU_006317 [Bradyrhizobium sp. USDA 4509]